jgi:two-component system, OmpR family, sensor histidine kinase BaeS
VLLGRLRLACCREPATEPLRAALLLGADQQVTLHEEVLRLGRMVEDLQTLAAAEAAALQLSRQPCDLAQIAAAEAEEWDASFAAARVSFTRRLEPTPVLADPVRLHQVIANLLSNALKFTPPGGQVGMNLERNGGQARLEVSDTGPGISPDDQPHVFDRLWRGAGAAQTAGSHRRARQPGRPRPSGLPPRQDHILLVQ